MSKEKKSKNAVPLEDAALVAFGQGTGRIQVTEEALVFLRAAYAGAAGENEKRIRAHYREHLSAARDLGLIARQVADQELSPMLTARHIERAREIFGNVSVPCPFCPALG